MSRLRPPSTPRPASAPYVEAYSGHPLAGAQAPHIKPADIKPAERGVRPSEILRPAEPKPAADEPARYVSPIEQTFGTTKTATDHKAADFKTPEAKPADVRTADTRTQDHRPTPAPARSIAPPIDFSSFSEPVA